MTVSSRPFWVLSGLQIRWRCHDGAGHTKRDIERLTESLVDDWRQLDNKLLTSFDRRDLKLDALSLMIELKGLVERL